MNLLQPAGHSPAPSAVGQSPCPDRAGDPPWLSRLMSITPCLTFMCRLRLPFRLNLLEQYGHLKGLLPACRCMCPSRLYMRLKDFPQTCGQRAHHQPPGLAEALQHRPGPQGPLGLPPRVTFGVPLGSCQE